MPLYCYKCFTCEHEFESIEKMDTRFTYCEKCGSISSRYKVELTSPPKLVAGIGGFSHPSHGERLYS